MTAKLSVNRRTFVASGLALAGSATLNSAVSAAETVPSLDAIARSRGLRFGTATDPEQLRQPDLASLIKRECSVIVAENSFKWKHIEPSRGRLRLEDADRLAAFAQANRMELRGHTLCWNQDNRIPDWVVALDAVPKAQRIRQLETLLQNHVERMCRRYPNVASWDAVNEVIQPGDGMVRSTVYTRAMDERFIDLVLHATKAAAPKAQLVYNDYMSWGLRPHHRNGVLKLLEGIRKRGAPLDALGIQAHLVETAGSKVALREWTDFLSAVEGLGLEILITELDCADSLIKAPEPAVRDRIAAEQVKAFLDVTLSFKSVRRVLVWGMADRDSYMRNRAYLERRARADGLPVRGHPFDDQLRPKRMRDAIALALASAPAR